MLSGQARRSPSELAFEFRNTSLEIDQALTYAELDEEARFIAGALERHGSLRGRPAILLYPPGLEFIAAFFGCLYAGVIPAPAMLSLTPASVGRIAGMVKSAGAAAVLANSAHLGRFRRALADRGPVDDLAWIATDEVEPDREAARHLDVAGRATDIAFLQYSSGSTGTPKGVAISHANILHNLHLLATSFTGGYGDRCVSWLPHHHDMGLVAGLLHSVYAGIPSVLLSPASFLREPMGWLRAIGLTGGTMSGGPNFAYDRCIAEFDATKLKGIDLSLWTVAIIGAEPVRPDTLERFADLFEPYGFRRDALYPTYGMAEATLMVSGGYRGDGAAIRPRPASTGFAGREEARERLVGCGPPRQQVVIAEPGALRICGEGEVGEILISGPSVSPGYWDPDRQTPTPMTIKLADYPDDHFLRSGDIGAVIDGQVVVTGRLKDLIIIRGRNVHPHDIEAAIERAVSALPLRSPCVMGVDGAEGEGVVVVIEVADGRSVKELTDAWPDLISKVVWAACEAHPEAVVFVRPGQIPRTTSGKLQRGLCRSLYTGGELQVLGREIEAV